MATATQSPDRPSAGPRFAPLFARWASRVRGRLALRRALSGTAIGLAIAIAPAGLAWRARQGAMRPYAALVGVGGCVAGLAFARRRRWSDTDVALFLDGRLGGDEAIATAIEIGGAHQDDEGPRATVVTRAVALLAQGDARRARPHVIEPLHALAPLALIALIVIARLPLPTAPPHVDPPGVARVTIAQAEGLEKIARLAQLDARDDAQRERLEKIARDAAKLKDELRAGMEKRQAQDELARLHDAIDAERLSLGDGEKRAGLESAVGRLQQTAPTRDAARALGDHDLETMDAEMERLANARERQDRQLADQALKEAAAAAKKGGAPDVGKALDEERGLLSKRGERSDALRDLAEAMAQSGTGGADTQRQLESLDREGSDAAARQLAKSMADALEKLTPEERKRLAAKLAQAARSGRTSTDPDAMKDLAKELSTAEGQKQLEERLEEMARGETESDEAKREQALDDAENGAGETQDQIDGRGEAGEGKGPRQGRGPRQGHGPGQAQGQGPGQGQDRAQGGVPSPDGTGGQANGDGKGVGGSHDTGTGAHHGETPRVTGGTLKSRAHGPLRGAEAMPGAVTTFAPGRGGGTANARGTGDLRTVGPSQIDGVDKSDVPEEYRSHVRQYFSP